MQSEEVESSSSSSEIGVTEMNEATGFRLDDGKQIVAEQYCSSCERQGKAKLLFTKIPKFGDIIVSSFHCKHCGMEGRDVQSASEIQNKGVSYRLPIKCAKDLSRGVVKSANATTIIPELELTIDARPMSGMFTTVEGMIRQIAENLSLLQADRRAQNPELADKIDDFILKVHHLLQKIGETEVAGETIAQLCLDDPSGNTFVEPLQESDYLELNYYYRNAAQAKEIGISEKMEKDIQKEAKTVKVDEKILDDFSIYLEQSQPVATLEGSCNSCEGRAVNRSVIINIPYFKECLLMCTLCDTCGYKSIEISSAGAIGKFGRKTTFKVTDSSDLSREVLKSDSSTIDFVELDLQLASGTLGGMYTTLEGLIVTIRDELKRHAVFWLGDSARDSDAAKAWQHNIAELNEYIAGTKQFTIVLDDPLDGSFIKNIFAPDPDPEMIVEQYIRTQEQDAEFGFDLMNVGDE